MATAKKKTEFFTSPIGVLKYPHLQQPYAYKGEGVEGKPFFSTQLILRGGPATELKNAVDEATAAFEKETKKRVKDKTYVEEEDGSLSFRFKVPPEWKDGKSRRPALFDADGQPILDAEYPTIGGGTKARIRYSVYCWTFAGKIGVRLELRAVQIVELAEHTDNSNFGFDPVSAGSEPEF